MRKNRFPKIMKQKLKPTFHFLQQPLIPQNRLHIKTVEWPQIYLTEDKSM